MRFYIGKNCGLCGKYYLNSRCGSFWFLLLLKDSNIAEVEIRAL